MSTKIKYSRNLVLIGLFLLGAAIITIEMACNSPAPIVEITSTAADEAYRNAVNEPPPGYTGIKFELSHDYPETLPAEDPKTTFAWLEREMDFSGTAPSEWGEPWNGYIMDILAYIKEGQNGMLEDQVGWDVNVNGQTRWFHVPWMVYERTSGREFVHGLTSERVAHFSDLTGSSQGNKTGFETWAFGVYNDFGGYSIGQAWNQEGKPETVEVNGKTQIKGLPFPEGTLVCKFLFTTATPEQVTFLEGSPEWTANRHVQIDSSEYDENKRELQKVYLVQVDVAVVDYRAPNNWVMGTFAYDGNIEAASPWDRLTPVGLQWGSDPKTFPATGKGESVPAYQSVLKALDIYEHYGCNGRLAGPVDNEKSSCLSCHGGAYAAGPIGTPGVMGNNDKVGNIPPIFGFKGLCDDYNDRNIDYFQNTKFPEPYSGGQYPEAISLDFSLQLQVAFNTYANFYQKNKPEEGK